MPWFVYMAEARTGRYYTGITNDIQLRIDKHNAGKGSVFAIEQGPFKLVYSSVDLKSKSAARIREIQIKGWSRIKKEQLISGVWD